MSHQKQMPSIARYMTPHPHSIGTDQPLQKALEMMREFHIRHLPVLENSQLNGIISDRDIKFAMSLKGIDIKTTLIRDIAHEDVYVANADTPLNSVINEMINKKLGSAVILDNNKVVGIFTSHDALKSFQELLETKLAY